ncbi:MAG: SusC/RagA family TonB-linked outer membrane protein, partial [Ferruginibacter sp.]|nr:SusC/RagA family TonB-linked outer membrane protein [Chitinophagaceae bacterium]
MKKNGQAMSAGVAHQIIKCLLLMKFTILLIVVLSLQSFARGYGQENISLRLDNAHLKKAFKTIEEQGVFRFVYKDEILPRDLRISINVQERPLNEVLDKMLSSTSLVYTRMNGNLVVITSDPAAARKNEVSPPAFVIISGKITDEKGEALGGVSIIEKGTTNGVTTRDDGLFVINVS